MSFITLLAYCLMLLGVVLVVIGGRRGVVWAVVFVVVGWLLKNFGVKTHMPGKPASSTPGVPSGSPEPETDREAALIRVEIKEAHAYAATKPSHESNDKLDFDLFVNVALVSEKLAEELEPVSYMPQQ